MRRLAITTLTTLLLTTTANAQEDGASWKRNAPASTPELKLFHSPQVVSLPTAEVLNAGEFQFEISHRFIPAFSDGYDVLYGLDGPVNMRLGLGYAPIDRLFFALARSNLSGNLDLQVKWQVMSVEHESLPMLVAVQGGGAWNTAKRTDRGRNDSRNFQAYAQLIVNTMIKKRLALGVVPSVLQNSDITSEDVESLFALGLYGQMYLNRLVSVLIEWTPDISGHAAPNQPIAIGFELETGGHFFKIFSTNSTAINPSQHLFGTQVNFEPDNWRLGFLITRLLWL